MSENMPSPRAKPKHIIASNESPPAPATDYGELVTRLRDAQAHAHSTGDAYGFELCGRSADVIEALTRENDQLRQDRHDALSVTSRDGLLSSEWVARTGKAERERDIARNLSNAVQRENNALANRLSDCRREVDEALDRNNASQERIAELEQHERQTHEVLGAILGTDSSLADCAKRWVVRAEQAEARIAKLEADAVRRCAECKQKGTH